MDGIVHAEGLHLLDEEACALHHHLHVAGLHRENQLVIVLLAADLGELYGTLGHALGGVAVARHDALAEGTVVGADAHGGAMGLANLYQARHFIADALQFVVVLLVGEMGLAGIAVGVVAGVDAHLFYYGGSHFGGLGVEVDVGHQGDGAAPAGQLILDIIEILCRLDIGGSDAHQLAAGLDQTEGLLDSGMGVHGVGVGHGLDSYGGSATQGKIAYCDLFAHRERVLFRSDRNNLSTRSFRSTQFTLITPITFILF